MDIGVVCPENIDRLNKKDRLNSEKLKTKI